MNGASSDVWYWLNSNFLVLSEGIEIKKKSLFSHTLLYDWSFFCSERMKAIETIKFNNDDADSFLTAR